MRIAWGKALDVKLALFVTIFPIEERSLLSYDG